MHTKKEQNTYLIRPVLELEGFNPVPTLFFFGPTRLYFCPLVFNDAFCGNSIRLHDGGDVKRLVWWHWLHKREQMPQMAFLN